MDEFDENLTKARDCAQFVANDLRAALMTAGAVEGMVLLPLIERAALLAADIERLRVNAAEDANIDAAMLAKAKEGTA